MGRDMGKIAAAAISLMISILGGGCILRHTPLNDLGVVPRARRERRLDGLDRLLYLLVRQGLNAAGLGHLQLPRDEEDAHLEEYRGLGLHDLVDRGLPALIEGLLHGLDGREV